MWHDAAQPLLTVLTLRATTQELGDDTDSVLPEACSGGDMRCCNGPVQSDICDRGDLQMCHLGCLIQSLQVRAIVWHEMPYYTCICTMKACCTIKIAEGSRLVNAMQESMTAHAFTNERIHIHYAFESADMSQLLQHVAAASKQDSFGSSMLRSCMGLLPDWQIIPQASCNEASCDTHLKVNGPRLVTASILCTCRVH